MSTGFVIQGESMVSLRYGSHLDSYLSSGLDSSDSPPLFHELGLALEEITVTPKFFHHDILADDFGPNVPPETLWMLGEVGIQMVLMYYDQYILDAALGESMGGLAPGYLAGGRVAPAGTPMGGAAPLYSSGCHYMGLTIQSSPQIWGTPGTNTQIYRFPACYLAAAPVEMKFSTKCTGILCSWRSIPYVAPNQVGQDYVQSSGVTLWDHTTG